MSSHARPDWMSQVLSLRCQTFYELENEMMGWSGMASYAREGDGMAMIPGVQRTYADDCLEGVIWSILDHVGKSEPRQLTPEDIISFFPDLATQNLQVGATGRGLYNNVSCRCKKGPCKYCACAKAKMDCTFGNLSEVLLSEKFRPEAAISHRDLVNFTLRPPYLHELKVMKTFCTIFRLSCRL